MTTVSTGASRQVESLQESAADVERLSAAAKTNTEVASRVSELGAEIHRVAARYREDVGAVATTLLGVSDVVQKTATQFEQLERQSESIDEFVVLIKRISSSR